MLGPRFLQQCAERFPEWDVRSASPPECAIIPGKHPDFGDVVIDDDGDELTVYVGKFTHSHFSNYDQSLDVEAREQKIVGDVLHFLNELFNDRVVLWGANQRSGGWYYPESTGEQGYPDEYVWSGPRRRASGFIPEERK